MITHTNDSYWINTQDKVKVTNAKNLPKLQIFEFWKKSLHTTHHLRLLDKMDPASIFEDTEWTWSSVHRRTDGRTRWNQYTPLSTLLKQGYNKPLYRDHPKCKFKKGLFFHLEWIQWNLHIETTQNVVLNEGCFLIWDKIQWNVYVETTQNVVLNEGAFSSEIKYNGTSTQNVVLNEGWFLIWDEIHWDLSIETTQKWS